MQGPLPFLTALLAGMAACAPAAESSRAADASPPTTTDGGDADPPCEASLTWSAPSPDDAIPRVPGHYSYAPAVVLDGELERIWMCRNAKPGVVRDHIFYMERSQGSTSAPRAVLAPSTDAGAWDSFHTCDPSVVEGEFSLAGEGFRYALFYTGNDVDGIHHCQLGVAFSKTLDFGGEWVRAPKPLVAHPDDGTWGVGQPSALSLGGSKVALAYTRADPIPHVYIRSVDLADAAAPVLGPERRVSEAGIVGVDGQPDVLTNVDIVVDGGSVRLLTERHPLPTDMPAGIATSLGLVRMPLEDLLSGAGAWQEEAVIDRALTGSSRNHNAGFARTIRGEQPPHAPLRLLYSDACDGCYDWLFTVGVAEVRAERCGL
jgi:hypothetical protein